MQMKKQKNVEVLCPYFQVIAGPVTFHAPYPIRTVEGVLSRHKLPFLFVENTCANI